ncbi:MAG: Xaa-Pro peptidase family protein [Candidatus Zapsychrus exili]|nr:Xaa-Pro peptidase family protein [Candidatus Zapsychrus exili]
MNKRLKHIISVFKQDNIDAFVVTKDANISYLVGFSAEDAWLLIARNKVFYITDSRYMLEVKKKLRGIKLECIKESLPKTLATILKTLKIKNIGFEGNVLTYAQHKSIKKACGTIRLVDRSGAVELLRSIKSKDEINSIKKSLNLHKSTNKYIKSIIKPDLTEKEIAFKIDNFVKSKGARLSFETIVASGVNSCYPHAQITGRKVLKNDIILVDMGVDLNGYKSDLTRMFFLGRIPKPLREVNSIVKEVQVSAIEKIAPGVSTADIDNFARKLFKKHKLDKFFTHSLGHGVGLEVHERPILSKLSQEYLKEGMIVTVEPGIYIPNKFGIRIEDMVLVTKKGYEILSGDIN